MRGVLESPPESQKQQAADKYSSEAWTQTRGLLQNPPPTDHMDTTGGMSWFTSPTQY